jgi:hypothetical protein
MRPRVTLIGDVVRYARAKGDLRAAAPVAKAA